MNPHDELKKICDTLNKELERANEKISRAGGSITGDDLSYIDRLTHAIKSVKTTIAMMEAQDEGESGYYMPMYGRSYGDRNYGMRDGNSYARRRDSMGRFTSRRGGMSYDDGMIEELRDLMDRAPDEQTRREFQKLITKLEQM
jgi:hypothetical protein